MHMKRVHRVQLFLLTGLLALLLGLTPSPAAANPGDALAIERSHPAAQAENQACGAGPVSLLAPANLADLPGLYTSFSFKPVEGVTTYILQVHTESSFSQFEPEKSERGYEFTIANPAVSSLEFSHSLVQNFLPETIYYWRVTPKCGLTLGTPSAVYQFTTPASGTILPAPVLIKPSDESNSLALGVTFTWQAVYGADSYQIRFYRYLADAEKDTAFLSEADGNVLDIHRTMTQIPEFPADSTFYWRVAAVNEYAVGTLSPVFRFTTPVESNSAIIDASGGKLITPSGVEVYFSPGVLSEPVELSFELNPHPSTSPPFRYGNRSFSLTATRVSDGAPVTEFRPWVDIRIYYAVEDLEYRQINGDTMADLYFWNGEIWHHVNPMAHDFEEHWFQYRITHFTEFALGIAENVFIPLTVR